MDYFQAIFIRHISAKYVASNADSVASGSHLTRHLRRRWVELPLLSEEKDWEKSLNALSLEFWTKAYRHIIHAAYTFYTHGCCKYYTVWSDLSLTTNFSSVNGGSSNQIRRSDHPLISGGIPAHGTSAVVSQPQGMEGAVLPIWPGYLQVHRRQKTVRKWDGWLPYHLGCEVLGPILVRLHRVKGLLLYEWDTRFIITVHIYIPLVILYFLLWVHCKTI